MLVTLAKLTKMSSWPWGLALFLAIISTAQAQLDNENSLLGVYMESGLVQGKRLETQELIQSSIKKASEAMTRGSLGVIFLDTMDDTMSNDTTAVMTVGSCENTHMWAADLAEMGKLHMAITDAGCRRTKYSTSLSIPLVSGSKDVVQLFTDLRTMNTLTWSDITIIHDKSISKLDLGDLVDILTTSTSAAKDVTITMVDLTAAEAASMRLGKLFSSLGPIPGEPQMRQYMVIAARDEIKMIQDLGRAMNLFGSKNQWLFVIPDTHSLRYNMDIYMLSMKDGDNMAFAYNMSEQNPTTPCKNGVTCYVELLIQQYGEELSNALKKELDLYYQVSEEEWVEVKPTPAQRAATIVKAMKMKQKKSQKCGVCTRWGVQAAEVKDAQRFELLNVADWNSMSGLALFDDLFPHITGFFRGRTIPVASLHFPPWQIFEKDATGKVVKYTGLMFSVLEELGSKLNFSEHLATTFPLGSGVQAYHSRDPMCYVQVDQLGRAWGLGILYFIFHPVKKSRHTKGFWWGNSNQFPE
ncbi:hypothetical protein SK128_009077 [Halocaridina rubra]|uniref:Uncharacterized protein n=1 Tax=Halocaridina rubra TaxID=373956 RepID=A0AAN9AFT6_HALRR